MAEKLDATSIDESLPLILALASLKPPPVASVLGIGETGLFGSLSPSSTTGNNLADLWISMHEKPPFFPDPLPPTDDEYLKSWLHPNITLPAARTFEIPLPTELQKTLLKFFLHQGLELNKAYAPVWENKFLGIPASLIDAFPDTASLMDGLMELAMPRLSALLAFRCSGLDSSVRELDLRRLNLGDFKLFKLAHALRFNTSVRKLDLRDNNISSKMMVLFTQLIGTHNFDILELNFDEGTKTLADKSKFNRNVGSLRKVKIEAVQAVLDVSTPTFSEDEQKYFASLVVPTIDKFLSINRSVAANLATKSDFFEFKCSTREYVVMKPVFQNLLVRLTHLRYLTIEGLFPPPPMRYPPFQEQIEQHYRKLVRHEADYQLPEVLGLLINLTELKFFNMVKEYRYLAEEYPVSYLSTVPECVSKLTNLKVLTMSGCGVENIPEGRLASLTQLEELELSKNYLTVLPDEIRGMTNMKKLLIESNRLHEIPECCQSLRMLQILHLDGNKLGARSYTGLKLLAQALRRLDDLKILNQQSGCLLPLNEAEFASVSAMAVRERDRKAPTPEFLIWLRSNPLESPVAAVSKPVAPDAMLKSGFLTKKGGVRRNWKRRWFQLTAETIKYYESNDAVILKGSIAVSSISNVCVAQHPVRGPLIEVHTPSRVYFLIGNSPQETEQWKVSIISAMNSYKLSQNPCQL